MLYFRTGCLCSKCNDSQRIRPKKMKKKKGRDIRCDRLLSFVHGKKLRSACKHCAARYIPHTIIRLFVCVVSAGFTLSLTMQMQCVSPIIFFCACARRRLTASSESVQVSVRSKFLNGPSSQTFSAQSVKCKPPAREFHLFRSQYAVYTITVT